MEAKAAVEAHLLSEVPAYDLVTKQTNSESIANH